ncbi:SKN7 [Candida theae]|uniref:Transcription factor n=1 Tax=Candida theae TaxID=1198502 RepID=A0AAD5BGW1_9ASCO|nr:SKN7 [Candida theae]KAI5962046.1 SKN7 [Candida theae]
MSSLDKPIAPNSTLATTASSNQSGSNDFVKKLFLMLQEDDYKDVVRWTQSGDSFVVINTNKFTKDILPRHFKHSNFASFVRQLNKYDFHKVKIPNEAKSTYPYGEDAWEFKHPDFKMNDRVSLENIKRKGPSSKKFTRQVPNGNKTSSRANAAGIIKHEESREASESGAKGASAAEAADEIDVGYYNERISQLNSGQNKLRDQINQVKDANQMLNQEINILQRKYQTLVEHIVSINSFNERYYRSIGVLVNSLAQAGIKLPPLDFPLPNTGPFQLQEPNSSSSSFPLTSSSMPASTLPSISQHLQSQSPRVNNLSSPLVPSAQTGSPRLPILQATPAANAQTSLLHQNNRTLSIPGGRPAPTSFAATSPISGLASLSRSSSIHQLSQPSFPIDKFPTEAAEASAASTSRKQSGGDNSNQNSPASDGNALSGKRQRQGQSSIDGTNNNHPPTSGDFVQPSPSNKPLSPMTSTSASPSGTVLPQIITTSIPNPKFHVLLVEDDNVCIQLCRKFLVKYGCQVTVVTDGLNAISTVESTKYDLVLMDIVMPNLDGATATSVIRSFDTRTPIIAMTGNIEDNDLVTYLQNGMSDILAKPFTKDDLYSILAKHLLKEEKSDEEPTSKKQRVE